MSSQVTKTKEALKKRRMPALRSWNPKGEVGGAENRTQCYHYEGLKYAYEAFKIASD